MAIPSTPLYMREPNFAAFNALAVVFPRASR